jgi:hypothetical protein
MHKRTVEQGSILMELMIASGVALVVIGALITTTVRQTSHRAVNLETTLVTNATLDVFARLRAAPFASLPSYHGTGFDIPDQHGAPAGLRPVPGDPDGLPGRIDVHVGFSAGTTILYRVTVTVQWVGIGGSRTERVIGYIGERK